MKTQPQETASLLRVAGDIAALLASPTTSTWLQTAFRVALDRDCVDAARDAEILAELLRRRCDALLEKR